MSLSLVVGLWACGADKEEAATFEQPVVAELPAWAESDWQPTGVVVPSSRHPYANNSSQQWTLNGPSCSQALRVRFGKIDLENGYDFIILRDAQNRVVQRITGSHASFVSEPVLGKTVKVELKSDWSVTRYGFDGVALEGVGGPVMCPAIAWEPCGAGTVDVNGKPGLCVCNPRPTCETIEGSSLSLISSGGFSGAGGGFEIDGEGKIISVNIPPVGGETTRDWVAIVDSLAHQEILRHLIVNGFFSQAGTSGVTGNMTSSFSATFRGVTRTLTWPTGDTSSLAPQWEVAVNLLKKATLCNNDPTVEGDALCANQNACSDVSSLCEPVTCELVDCAEGYHCEVQDVVCIRAPCPPIATCVENPPWDPCMAVRCSAGFHCESDGDSASCEPNGTECSDTQACPGSGECANGNCECNVVYRCPPNMRMDSSPEVCACVPFDIIGCEAMLCAPGHQCVEDEAGNGACLPTEPQGCVCTKEYNAQCGTNGVTYGNPCMLACAGVALAHAGACGLEGDVCGGTRGASSCQEGLVCRYGEGQFTAPFPAAEGECVNVGYCEAVADCNAQPLMHIMCVGGWSCEANSCAYHCGPQETWRNQSANFGSASPYQNNQELAWRLTAPAGATQIRVPFASFNLEDGYDFVILYDEAWHELYRYTGNKGAFTSDAIQGRVGYLVFRSDASVVKSGFRASGVEYATPN